MSKEKINSFARVNKAAGLLMEGASLGKAKKVFTEVGLPETLIDNAKIVAVGFIGKLLEKDNLQVSGKELPGERNKLSSEERRIYSERKNSLS